MAFICLEPLALIGIFIYINHWDCCVRARTIKHALYHMILKNDKRDELLKKVGVLSGHDHDRSFRVVSSMRLEFTKPSPQYKFSDSMIYNHNFELMNVSFCLFTFKTHEWAGIVLTVFSKWQEGRSDHISS